MINLLIIILYAIGNQFQISLIGQMSISDVAVLAFYLYLPTNRKMVEKLTEDKNIQTITLLYGILFFIQVIAETMIDNELESAAKSLAVTILSYLKFIFLWLLITRKQGNIWWLLLFTSIASLTFKDHMEEASLEDMLAGEEMGYLKFFLAPLICDIVLLISLYFKRRILYPLFIGTGIFLIILGARSAGLMLFLTGVVAFFIRSKDIINRNTIYSWGIFLTVLCYALYVLYVNAVLSGNIVSGNSSDQLKRLDNPYNPISLLFTGRTESTASLKAIADSPWIGWGAWRADPNYKYHRYISKELGEKFDVNRTGHHWIPTHSVIFGAGVNNGVFAIIAICAIIFYFIYKGGKSLTSDNPYLYLIIFCIMELLWNGFFSPTSHFRYSFPEYFVYCLFSYKLYMRNKNFQKLNYAKKYLSSHTYSRKPTNTEKNR